MEKTILSSLESRWGVRQWAADLVTRHAHVGNLGKTAVQFSAVQNQPETLRNAARRSCTNKEDTFFDGIFLGMRLRSVEILVRTTRGVIKTRTPPKQVEEKQWDNEFARSVKGEPRQLVLGINKAGVHLEENQTDACLGQQEARQDSMPPS